MPDRKVTKDTLVYHGTTKASWAKSEAGTLYLTSSLEEAKKYAEGCGESEWDDDIHVAGVREPALIVLAFNLSDLTALAASNPIQLDPDWGWVEGLEHDLKANGKKLESHPTWEDSLEHVGSFCIEGFDPKFKVLAKEVEHAFEQSVISRPRMGV